MTQKQKNIWLGVALTSIATILLLLLSPLGNFLRGDLISQNTVAQEKGMYLGYKTLSASGEVLKAGTGVVLENDGKLYGSGLVIVDIYSVTGSGSLTSNSLSGVLTYNPSILSAHLNLIQGMPGVTVDSFVTGIIKNSNGTETGTLRFQFNKNTAFTKPREKVAQIAFATHDRRINTDVELKSLRLLAAPTLASSGEFYLDQESSAVNFANKALPVITSGHIVETEVIETTNSGTVIKETHTFPDDSQYIKETWTEKDPNGDTINHTLETYKDPDGNITKTVHTIEYPDGTKTVIETTYPDGIITETRYAADGHITEIIKTYPDGTIEHWWYDTQNREIRYEKHSPGDVDVYIRTKTYDPAGITTEEWWYHDGKLIKHQITYPDGATLVETYTYNPDGSYTVHSEYTDKNGSKIIIDKKYDKDGNLISAVLIKDEITLSTEKNLSAGNGEIVLHIPAKATLMHVDPSIIPQSPENFTPPEQKSYATGIYKVELVNKNDGSHPTTFFIPSQITFTINPASITPAGKTIAEIIPVVYDTYTNKWTAVPAGDIISKTNAQITFNTTTTGIYSVLVRFTDNPPISLPNYSSSGVVSYKSSDYFGAGKRDEVNTNTNNARSTCTPAVSFKDIRNHWGEDYIEEARLNCLIEGKKPGFFEPNSLITRAELTKIVVNAFKKQIITNLSQKPFIDVRLTDWFATVVATAKAENMISGYADRTFKPNISINRAEALKIIVEATKTEVSERPSASIFQDITPGIWFGKYVSYGQSFLQGYRENGRVLFKPANSITRAEAVKIIMEVIKKNS
ncbi:MAG: S-layer homology domain-containing protein [Candidatus Gracilibacteria bacterium]